MRLDDGRRGTDKNWIGVAAASFRIGNLVSATAVAAATEISFRFAHRLGPRLPYRMSGRGHIALAAYSNLLQKRHELFLIQRSTCGLHIWQPNSNFPTDFPIPVAEGGGKASLADIL